MNATEKIHQTIVKMRSPDDDAGGPELALATLVQGLSAPAVQGWLNEQEASDNLDPFLVALATWVLSHTSDNKPVHAIVPLPRHRDLPSGQILNYVERARAIALAPPPDLLAIGDNDDLEGVELADELDNDGADDAVAAARSEDAETEAAEA